MNWRKWFPDTELKLTRGLLQEGGTSTIDGQEKKGPQRWVKVNGIVFLGMDDGLYHTRYDQEVSVVYDQSNKVVGYWNHTSDVGTQPSKTAIIGAIALSVMVSAALFLLGVWNFVWKYPPFVVLNESGEKVGERWWLTVIVVGLYSMWAVVWTAGFVKYEKQRQRQAHLLLEEQRK
jgi:hypothetical protein